MKYKKKWVAVIVALTFLGNFFPVCIYAITITKEEEISQEFLKIVFSRYKLINDPHVVDYVNKIGQKIVKGLPPQPFEYSFYVVDEDEYNAFAGPGGHVFINTGLLMAMETEGELAGILGHEISHVSCRHISDRIEKSKKIGLGTLAGIAAGIFLGVGGASTAASAVTMGSIAAGQTVALKYSRENEMQADQIGLGYLYEAGYSGEGLLKILKKMRAKQWFGSEQIPTYLVTHPALEDRITYLTTMIEKRQNEVKPLSEESEYEFQRVRVRLVGVYGDESIALAEFKTKLSQHPDDPMAHYGYGLALERTGNNKEAIVHLKKSLEQKAFDPYILQDLGRIYFFNSQYQEALITLKSSLDIKPDIGSKAKFYLARTFCELEEYKKAEKIFLRLIEEKPVLAQTYYYLAEIYDRQGEIAEPNYYLGLYNHHIRNYRNALFHFNKAVGSLKDPEKLKKAKEIIREIEKIQLDSERQYSK